MLTFENHSSRPGGKKLSSEMRMRVMSHIFFSVFTHKMHNFFCLKKQMGCTYVHYYSLTLKEEMELMSSFRDS